MHASKPCSTSPGPSQLTLPLWVGGNSQAQQAQAHAPEPTQRQLLQETRRMWQQRPHWRRRYRTLDQALRDPIAGKALTVCARLALLARATRVVQTAPPMTPGF